MASATRVSLQIEILAYKKLKPIYLKGHWHWHFLMAENLYLKAENEKIIKDFLLPIFKLECLHHTNAFFLKLIGNFLQ